MTRLTSFLAIAAVLAAPLSVAAQGHAGVSNSGMGQGEARISSRSDVRLAMESMPGTSGSRVEALGQRVAARMPQIRGCYEETVAENPMITGALRMRVLVERPGRPNIEIDRDEVGDRGLVQCVTRQLSTIDVARLERPTRAIVRLEMANTAARSAERAQVAQQEAQQVQVQIDGSGNPTSSAGAEDGLVRFTVTGRGAASAPTVAAAHRALLTALPGLLDCRRRSGRQGRAEAGELRVAMQVATGRPPQSRVTASTVPNERARTCVSRVLGRIEHRPTEGRGRVEVRISFAAATPVEAAQPE